MHPITQFGSGNLVHLYFNSQGVYIHQRTWLEFDHEHIFQCTLFFYKTVHTLMHFISATNVRNNCATDTDKTTRQREITCLTFQNISYFSPRRT